MAEPKEKKNVLHTRRPVRLRVRGFPCMRTCLHGVVLQFLSPIEMNRWPLAFFALVLSHCGLLIDRRLRPCAPV